MYKLIREFDGVMLGMFTYEDFREFVDGFSYRCTGMYYDYEYECEVHTIIVDC